MKGAPMTERLIDLLRLSLGLTPCPCGSSDLDVWDGQPGYAVHCESCGAEGPKAGSHEEAVMRWNEAERPAEGRG